MAAEDYFDISDYYDQSYWDRHNDELINPIKLTKRKRLIKMPTKRAKKPILIKVGGHLIEPTDVSCISRIRSKNLYIVRLKSQPNMEFPIWVGINQIETLLDYFNIITSDIPEEDN